MPVDDMTSVATLSTTMVTKMKLQENSIPSNVGNKFMEFKDCSPPVDVVRCNTTGKDGKGHNIRLL